MDIDRREFLIAAGLAALSPLLLATRGVVLATSAAAPVLRPSPTVASGLVCARCGSSEHHLLSGACSQEAQLLAALQAVERHRVSPGGRAT